jgi:hypothetical protein
MTIFDIVRTVTVACPSCGSDFEIDARFVNSEIMECGMCWDIAHGNLNPEDMWEF